MTDGTQCLTAEGEGEEGLSEIMVSEKTIISEEFQ